MKNTKQQPNSRKIQAEERRLQILDAALVIFAEKGFANTTIIDLAEAAGISSGLMYHYFSSKEKLLEAAVEHHSFLPELREILKDTNDRQCREVFKKIALRFIDLLEQKSMIVKIFLREGSSNTNVQKVWSAMANEGVALFQKYVVDRIASGELRPHNAEVTARSLFSIILMYHFTRDIFKTGKITRVQFIENVIDNVLKGIQNNRA